jgi:chromosomal replication initiation ATPase DnaA
MKFIGEDDSGGVLEFFKKKNIPSILGSQSFIEQIRQKYRDNKRQHDIPEAKLLNPGTEEIKKIVSEAYDVDMKSLLTLRRGRINEPRRVAVYLSRKHTAATLERIATEFNMNKYSSAGSIIERTKAKMATDKKLKKKVEKIEKQLIKYNPQS